MTSTAPSRTLSIAAFCAGLMAAPPAGGQDVRLPLKDGSFRFAIIGDTGTASRAQSEVGAQMAAFRARFPFEIVIMVGDNIYGGDTTEDFRSRFEEPYEALLDGGVKFYAALGNHDNPTQRNYKAFNMSGQRFYSVKPQQGVRLFSLDSTYMDKPQLDWIEKELASSGSEWKICFFHHPLYSSGKTHGSSLDLRTMLEPIFLRYGVDVVFSGHDHFYERIKPQQGITYFVSGAGGSLRKGNIKKTDLTAVGYDQDFHFMLAEIAGDELFFQAVSRTGQSLDSGVIRRRAPAPGETDEGKVPSPSASPGRQASPSPPPKPPAKPSPSPPAKPKPTATPPPSPPR